MATGTASVAGTRLQPAEAKNLPWRDCGPAGLQCAELQVPLDYANPGRTITIALNRLPATKPGAVAQALVNPGGPGASGLDYVAAAATEEIPFTARLRERVTLIGFDPRGVGQSTPIECVDGPEQDKLLAGLEPFPNTVAEGREFVADSKAFAHDCRENSGYLLPHVSTTAVARDMDTIREAIGERELTYIGFSYGTALGAVYASLYPGKVRALVLDGALNPETYFNDPKAHAGRQAESFDKALDGFLAACRKAGPDNCALGAGRPGEALDDLLDRLDTKPLAVGTRRLTAYQATWGIIAALYDQRAWPVLVDALTKAGKGNGAPLLALADVIFQRDAEGRYSSVFASNAAISCIDAPDVPRSFPGYATLAAEFGRTAKRFGRAAGYNYGLSACAFWPVRAVERYTGPFDAAGAPPIVVVGTTGDPATAYQGAVDLAEQLDAGRLLTVEGFKHTAYASGNACVDRHLDAYLIDLTVPPVGLRCPSAVAPND